MTKASPRVYKSDLRASRTRETRDRIIAASSRLFAEQGYERTSIASIAQAAGVSPETVKVTAPKVGLLLAACEDLFQSFEHMTRSALESEALHSGVGFDDCLDAFLTHVLITNSRYHALWSVVQEVSLSHPEVNDAKIQYLERRLSAITMVMDSLVDSRHARPLVDLHSSSEVVSFLLSPEGYRQLVVFSAWTEQSYASWLHTILQRQTRLLALAQSGLPTS